MSWNNWEINAESPRPAYFCNWQAYVEPKQKILLQCKGFRLNISEEVVVLDFFKCYKCVQIFLQADSFGSGSSSHNGCQSKNGSGRFIH